MSVRKELKQALINLNNEPREFEILALEIFRYQFAHNPVYRSFSEYLGKTPDKVHRIEKIPFLPIEFFKTQSIKSGEGETKITFESSGTTSANTSRHFVSDPLLYELLSRKAFEDFYGELNDYHIFALLPSYLERNNSSLVYMVQNFIEFSYSNFSGFFLDNMVEMVSQMEAAALDRRKILLIGVSFGLLDLAEDVSLSRRIKQISEKLIVMETGGMKGRRKEMIRQDLHKVLGEGLGVGKIHSEYGMTELLSQGYSKGDGIFFPSKTMKILLREVNDPLSFLPHFSIGEKPENTKMKTGGINVIDLANIDSCSFIETQDLGVFTEDYSGFEVVGRFDNSDIRGCNLLVG